MLFVEKIFNSDITLDIVFLCVKICVYIKTQTALFKIDIYF